MQNPQSVQGGEQVHTNVEPQQQQILQVSPEPTKKITLITSFWAPFTTVDFPEQAEKNNHLHRQEIEAAILSNLNNPQFHQVVVILDSVTEQYNCDTFNQHMQQLQQQFDSFAQEELLQQPQQQTALKKIATKDKPMLHCVEKEEQPTYYQMFQDASDPDIVMGDIVVLANADQAFDDSIQWAKFIKPETILTLSTWGFYHSAAPQQVAQYFQFVHGNQPRSKFRYPLTDRCHGKTGSWDTYVFSRNLVHGNLVDDQHFQRPTRSRGIDGTPTPKLFQMNEYGGENAGLKALLDSLKAATGRLPYAAEACAVIQSWHFHAGPKMHAWHNNKNKGIWDNPSGSDRVPRPYARATRRYQDAFIITPPQSETIPEIDSKWWWYKYSRNLELEQEQREQQEQQQ